MIRYGTAIMIWSGKKILIGKRLVPNGLGFYALPGGSVEEGEQPLRAAQREVLEETGLYFDEQDFLPVTFVEIQKPDGVEVTFFYSVELKEDMVPKLLEPEKCEDWFWIDDLIDLFNYPLWDGTAEIVLKQVTLRELVGLHLDKKEV